MLPYKLRQGAILSLTLKGIALTTLILWDAERQRTVTLGNVTFPE
jgi:hypothetical protein